MLVKGGVDEMDMDEDGDPDDFMLKQGNNLDKLRKEVVKPKALKTIDTMQKLLASRLVSRHSLDQGF